MAKELPERNEGVIITGGKIQRSQIIAGRNMNVSIASGAEPEVAQALQEVHRLLARHRAELDRPKQAENAVSDLEDELRGRRDRRAITEALQRLAERVSAVGGLAAAVAALKQAVESVLS